MRTIALLSLAVSVCALQVPKVHQITTAAKMTRGAALRIGLLGAASALLGGSPPAVAEPSWDPYQDFLVGPEKNAISDYEFVQAQRVQPGKLDLNSALVTDYKVLRGMYPHAAGQIASNGPYKSVDDLFRIPTATDHDKELFRQYRAELTVLPPGRVFYERINARQST